LHNSKTDDLDPAARRDAFWSGFRLAILKPPVWGVLGVTTTGATWVFRGDSGAIGVSLGLVFGLFSLWVLWRLVKLMGAAAPHGPKATLGIAMTILLFLLKVPMFFAMMVAVYRIGDPAPGCFMAGVTLVYSLAVGWAAFRH